MPLENPMDQRLISDAQPFCLGSQRAEHIRIDPDRHDLTRGAPE